MAERWMGASGGSDERLAAVLATLERGIEAMLTSDGFAAYLRAIARFPTYSARNVALINAQNPNASRVLGYRAWQTLGRQVRRGERGIRILAPYRRTLTPDDGEEATAERTTAITGFGVATVFDIAQTDGEPLPAPTAPQLLAGDSPVASWLWDRLAAFLADEAVPLDRRPLAQGYGVYFPVIRRVAVLVGLDGDQATKTLAHECAHHVALTRAIGRHEASRADAETIAEGAAFAVLARYGLDSGDYSFPYVAAWAADRAVLARNLATIRETAVILIAAVEGQPNAGLDGAPVAA
jgi:hypothetical protein